MPCGDCKPGHYCPAVSDPVPCPYGTYNNGTVGFDVKACLVCPQRHKTDAITGATECVYDTPALIATCVVLGILGCITLTNWFFWIVCPGLFCCHSDQREDELCRCCTDGSECCCDCNNNNDCCGTCMNEEDGQVGVCCTAMWANIVVSVAFMIFLGVWFNTRASWYEPYMGG